jgi:WD40 repeat protein
MMIALPEFAADTSILRLEPVTYERIWGETKILSYSPNGRFVLSMIEKGALHVWEANTGNLLRLFSNPGNKIDDYNNNNIVAACFSPDSSQIIIADNNNHDISFYNIMTGIRTRQFTINSPVDAVSCSQDGKYILLRSKNDIEIRSYDTCITMWRYAPTGNQNRLLTAIFVPQHPEVCIVTNEYKQQTWRYADEAITAKYGKAGYIVGISPNNRQIIIVKKDKPNNFQLLEQDGDNLKQIEEGICNLKSQYQTSFNIELTVWKRIFIDITTGKENAIINRFDAIVKSVLFLPDGNHVLAVEEEYNNNVYLYFAKCILVENTSNVILKSIDTPRNSFRDIATSSDGKLFMVVDNKNSSIYDLATGKVLQNFGNKDTKSAMFSPDNNTILIAENGELGQQLISIINITTNKEIVTFDSKIANTWSFATSDKMQYLMIGRDDHTASVWDLYSSSIYLIRWFHGIIIRQ